MRVMSLCCCNCPAFGRQSALIVMFCEFWSNARASSLMSLNLFGRGLQHSASCQLSWTREKNFLFAQRLRLRDESQPLVLPLKTLTSIKKLWETGGMTYELLLENFLAWKFCIVYCTATGVLIFIELLYFTLAKLDYFRCTLRSVANHVIAWDRSHAKRDE